ncbi:MAG TPA: hypothetical protein PLV92_26430, partial [Pirellulaceae bacterium]|nr:hypothetical protein [Pirellulaceae bacterium]
MRVDYDRGARQLSTSNGDRLVASIPLKTRANWDLYSYTLQPVAGLRTGATGDSPALGVITCSQDGTVACFDPETLIPRRTFLGHSSRVWAASVSQGQDLGKRLITAGSDGLIKIWSLEDFKPTYNVAALTDDDDRVTYVYPNTPSSSEIAIGDKIESIGGQVPSDWILSEAARTPAQTPTSVVVARNGRRLTVEVMLTDMGDVARPLVTGWVSEDGGQWIVWTEDGYFDSSAGATERVGWLQVPADERSARFVTAGQLRESRRRPEIIAAALNSGRAPASSANSIVAQPTATQPQPARTPSASTAVVQPASPQSPPARAAQPPAADAAFVPPPVPPPVHILTPATQTPREQIDVWAVVIVPQDLRAE